MQETLEVAVAEAGRGARLDAYLAQTLPQLSRTRLKELIEAGQVACQGHVVTTASLKLKGGEVIVVTIPPAAPAAIAAQEIPLDVVFEDEDIIVINKSAGLVVHPGAGNVDQTLVNALLHYCGDRLSGIGGVERPGIVHRLDKGTSGLMVVAKNDAAHHSLSAQFADRTLSRLYLALVWGVPNPLQGVVEGHIGRSRHDRQKMALVTSSGKPARTHYITRRSFGRMASLVECKLDTGRTHQIRVHMTSIQHPLIGDPQYGRPPRGVPAGFLAKVNPLTEDNTRPCLHAWRLQLRHPRTGELCHFETDPPADFLAVEALLSTQT
ncbi:MAG: RluA family pseudouridine synthase [Holosporales bacterium]